MKKCLILALTIILTLSMCACTPKQAKSNTKKETLSGSTVNHLRLKRVTTTYEGETTVCNLTWDADGCHFESYMNYYKDDIENYLGFFDTDERVFSITMFREDGDLTIPIFQYDKNQTIIKMYNEDRPTESWDVTYDDHGIATIDGRTLCVYDAEARSVKRPLSSGSTNGVPEETYEVATIDKNGNFQTVTRITYVGDENGDFQKDSEEVDYKKYTYDANGNLIKYEEPLNDGLVIEFEYYDQPVEHAWERVIPVHYIDFFDVYFIPFLWYVK